MGIHAYAMGFIWSPGANLAILLAILSYRKQYVWLHSLYFFLATAFSLGCSVPIIYASGISHKSVRNMFASFSIVLMTVNTLLGIMIKFMVIVDSRSLSILKIRKIHKYLGYVTVLACKATTYIKDEDNRIGWIVIDVFSVVLLVLIKLYFPKLESKDISPKYEEEIPTVKSIKDMDQTRDYIVFANKIYDIKPLRYNHPAGYQICEVFKNKEVDRFIYGSCLAD